MRKSRKFYLSSFSSAAKLQALENLHSEYRNYLSLCINFIIQNKLFGLNRSDCDKFLPESNTLSSGISQIIRFHSAEITARWFENKYRNTLKKYISNQKYLGNFTDQDAKALSVIGKKSISKPWKYVSQNHIDIYMAMLFDQNIGGNPLKLSNNVPMKFTEVTGKFEKSKTNKFPFWIRISNLEKNYRLSLPLNNNPNIKFITELSNSFFIHKDKNGKWYTCITEKDDFKLPQKPDSNLTIGIDVGLNAIIADSKGNIYGKHIRKRFEHKRQNIRHIRVNRQRQKLDNNSKRLDKLESNLSGYLKTEIGKITNKISKKYSDHTFVLEDLNLSGTRGQKRFLYKFAHNSLKNKAYTTEVNAIYTSQECSDCFYINKKNRKGIDFCCRSCGSKRHADINAAINIEKRFFDKNINAKDAFTEAKQYLRKRYVIRRNVDSFLDIEFLGLKKPKKRDVSLYPENLLSIEISV